ncbi:MAG: metalloregulator ArsR/SmtB family transcription factor [Rhodospirillales bacterium]|jgi:ArsR family transcriptional regulator|nr:metalloregulator ArsR/SmtB family transcription factor [Rhodospirillales bacterium]
MNGHARFFLEEKAKVLKALGHPTRLFIAEELGRGERCVCQLVEMIGADFSTVSRHLSVLKQAGIVEDEKRGMQVFYRLRVPCVLRFMDCVEAVIASRVKQHVAMLA